MRTHHRCDARESARWPSGVRAAVLRLLADDEGTETLETLMLLAVVALPIIIGLIKYKNFVMQNFAQTWDELTRG